MNNKSEQKYHLVVGTEYQSYDESIRISNETNVLLDFDSIDDIRKVIDFCRIKHFEIYQGDCWHENLVERSTIWQEIKDKQKSEQQERNKAKQDLCDKINSMTLEPICVYKTEYHTMILKIYVKRDKATYNPSRSRSIDCPVSNEIILLDKKTKAQSKLNRWDLNRFVSRDKRILRKQADHGLNTNIKNDNERAVFIDNILEMVKVIDNAQNTILNGEMPVEVR